MRSRYALPLVAMLSLSVVACGDDDDDDDGGGPECNPPCPMGQVCQAGAGIGAPNECVAAPANPRGCFPACGAGQRCVNGACVAGGDPGGCDPACGAGQQCVNGRCTGGGQAGEFGAACGQSADCRSGICVTPPNQPQGFCSRRCAGGDCPAPYTCREVQPGTSICLPGEGPPPGGLSCREVAQCIDQCGDDACRQGCLDRGTPEARQAFAALVQCFRETGCARDDTCDQQCGQQVRACAGGEPPPPPPGGTTCPEIVQCINQCADDPCAQACLDRGTPEAQQAFAALVQCAQRTGCGQNGTCDQQCPAELQACFGGGG